jgi:hypothetical protein
MGEERFWSLPRSISSRAGVDDEARRDPDAIEAVYKKLTAVDEAGAARRDLCG